LAQAQLQMQVAGRLWLCLTKAALDSLQGRRSRWQRTGSDCIPASGARLSRLEPVTARAAAQAAQ